MGFHGELIICPDCKGKKVFVLREKENIQCAFCQERGMFRKVVRRKNERPSPTCSYIEATNDQNLIVLHINDTLYSFDMRGYLIV